MLLLQFSVSVAPSPPVDYEDYIPEIFFDVPPSLPPPPPPPAPATHKSIQGISIILICCIIITAFLSVFLRYYCPCYRPMPRTGRRQTSVTSHTTNGLPNAATGDCLDQDVINSFPTFIYSEVKGHKIGKGALECAVCLNEFEDHETLRLLPYCSHVFHCDCIGEWLSSHVTCPVCRADVSESLHTSLNPDWGRVSCDESVREARHDSVNPDAVVGDFVIIPIQSPDAVATKIQTPSQNGTRGSESESLARQEEEWERFTLRLPEELRSLLVGSKLNRTRSCGGFQMARSLSKGLHRSGSVGTGRIFTNSIYSEELERSDQSEFMETVQSLRRPNRFSLKMIDGHGGGGSYQH
ncbi:hypothetical protein Vadar_030295 [Vaccinium darrowii]|uniref:Uncharacterized protein n=1 Tax=Vaccinium darrowii TaxID=229202 RepID=A0ACB7Y9U7_9ERIC|nr:hypothetical protein Vadar_030295 [Vaccinium darrowii]